MNFEVVFLGTGAAVPVPSRGTTSQFVDIHGHTYLLDAGEGVQLSLRKNKRKFQKLKGVFISHMHGITSWGCRVVEHDVAVGTQRTVAGVGS